MKRSPSSPTPSPNGRRAGNEHFELRKSPIQGRGAFALRRIRKGARIAEYTGERISRAEADRRYDDESMARHHTFLFAVDDDTVVDGAVGGNASRYINHSCEPNCEAVIEDGRIFVQALRNIQPGVELSYDYAYERHADHDEETERLYACRCGTASCRGTILAPPAKKAKRPAKQAAQRQAKRQAKRRPSRSGR